MLVRWNSPPNLMSCLLIFQEKLSMELIVGIHAVPGIAGSRADLRKESRAAGRRGRQQDNRQSGGIAGPERHGMLQKPMESG